VTHSIGIYAYRNCHLFNNELVPVDDSNVVLWVTLLIKPLSLLGLVNRFSLKR